MEMNGSKIKTGQIILSWSLGQTQSCRVVEKTQQLTEKDKETPKKTLGVLSLLSSSSEQGVPIKAKTNLGTDQKLEKTVPRGLGSATNLLKVCQILETPTIKEEVMVLDANMADKSFNERMETDQYNLAEELRRSKKRSLLYRIYNLSPNESRFP